MKELQTRTRQTIAGCYTCILAIPFICVLTIVLMQDKDFVNGIITYKDFRFFEYMGFVSLVAFVLAIRVRKIFRFSVMDLLVLLFIVAVYFSAFVFNDASANTTKLTVLFLLVVLYFSLRLYFNAFGQKRISVDIFCLFLVITGLIEAVWGLLQLYGFERSLHSLFRLTGSFYNPGPYAGYLAVIFPLAFNYLLGKSPLTFGRSPSVIYPVLRKWIAVFTCIAIILVLPASMSRASWLAVIAGSIVAWFSGTNLHGEEIKTKIFHPFLFSSRLKTWIIGCVVIILLTVALTGMYFLKKDSADGRALMWKISLQTIVKHPFGVGLGNFSGAYGETQATYMAGDKASDLEKYVAGTPEYGFNLSHLFLAGDFSIF